MAELPTGTVTLLFTDIEGSTRLLQELGHDEYAKALARHREILRRAFSERGGYEVDYEGDAFFVSFPSAADAVAAAVFAQRALDEEPWPEGCALHVRMGLHTGQPLAVPPKYVGLDVHRAARIMAAGHGGQVLLSQATQRLVAEELPKGVCLRDLGEHPLKDLAQPEWLFQLEIEGLESEFPALKTLGARPTNLPRQATPLIGRRRELDELASLLRRGDAPLITLTGPGGSGKTRLALTLAAEMLGSFASGAFFVDLSPLSEPDLVVPTIAQTLKLRESHGQSLAEMLPDYLAEKEMLLVVDNVEHVIASAPLLGRLLGVCPRLTLVATSREPLRIEGEWEYSVLPLAEDEAVRLFSERAAATGASPATNGIAPQICRRLDNLPLAIELAAAWARALSPPQILDRLERSLPLLSRGRQDAPERQRTLRSTIQWSYELLSDEEQRLFRRLGVFSGGCTLEAAERVCEADADGLASLVEKSLLRHAGERFSMLQTIREYALEKLEESEDAAATLDRRTEYFAGLADEAYAEIRGPDQVIWMARLEEEHDNLRETLARAKEMGDGELELRLAVDLGHFRGRRGYMTEGRLALEEALAVGRDPKLRARALHERGFSAQNQGLQDEAEALLEEGWALARQLDDVRLTGSLLLTLAGVVSDRDEARAEALFDELLAFIEEHGEESIPTAFVNLADFALRRGDYAAAERYSQKGLSLLRDEGDTWSTALALGNLGLALLGLGRQSEACERLIESLRLYESLGDKFGIAASLLSLAAVAADRGKIERTTRLLAQAVLLLGQIEAEFVGVEADLYERMLARARAELDDFETVWLQGQAMTFQEAIADAVGMSACTTSSADTSPN